MGSLVEIQRKAKLKWLATQPSKKTCSSCGREKFSHQFWSVKLRQGFDTCNYCRSQEGPRSLGC